MQCVICGKRVFSRDLPVCVECSRKESSLIYAIHERAEIACSRERRVEEKDFKKSCCLCTNFCSFGSSASGLCRLRGTRNGEKYSFCSPNWGMLSFYEDPLPTNCCNAWFCKGSRMIGMNLAVFYYGCNFDCLFCQNWEHKRIEGRNAVHLNEIVKVAMTERIKCICHFGGSPEPQMAFALRFSKRVAKKKDVMICWEWNGAGREKFVLNAAEISSKTCGTVKFDLKAWNDNLHRFLTGRTNSYVLKNFERVFDHYPEVLSATTLLVPYYVDEREIEGIASFISSLDDSIPYSLLVFHPAYRLKDLPVTPVEQVRRCYSSAKKYLKNVNIGNLHLLGQKFRL